MAKTTITVTDEVWGYLHDRKERGETFDAVLRQELGIARDEQEAQA